MMHVGTPPIHHARPQRFIRTHRRRALEGLEASLVELERLVEELGSDSRRPIAATRGCKRRTEVKRSAARTEVVLRTRCDRLRGTRTEEAVVKARLAVLAVLAFVLPVAVAGAAVNVEVVVDYDAAGELPGGSPSTSVETSS